MHHWPEGAGPGRQQLAEHTVNIAHSYTAGMHCSHAGRRGGCRDWE